MNTIDGNYLYDFTSIGRILFGVNAAESVGQEAKNLVSGHRCLIVTDPGIAKAGFIGRIQASLESEEFDVEICDQAKPEPSITDYQFVLEVAKDKKPDIIIGLGGGSSMDISKTVASALANPGELKDYLGGEFAQPGRPLITIPTTSGTGAEITPDAVVRLPEEKVKSCFLNTRATLAIIDPTLTLTLPRRLTVGTGIDALSHAIESALSKISTPLTHALALESIRLISKSLRIAASDGDNLQARTDMAWATVIEALSEGNAGDVEGHAVAHVLGGYYKVHHGEACSIALPYCMKLNLPVNTPILARIARALDESATGTEKEMAEQGIESVSRLIQDLEAPACIADIDQASRDDLPELVKVYCNHPEIAEIIEPFSKLGAQSEADATKFWTEMFEPFRLR